MSKEDWHKTSRNRRSAIKNGYLTYKSYKVCPNGHQGSRYTKTGQCVKCAISHSREKVKSGYYKENHRLNAEQKNAISREYYKSNKDRVKENNKKWTEKNKDKVKAIKHNYKARRRAQERGGVTSNELHKWAELQSKRCYWCGCDCKDNYQVDHYFPLAKGGKHEIENLVISCPPCNNSKSAKDPYVWAKEIGRLF